MFANTLTPMSPTFWSRVMGRKMYKANVYLSLASFSEEGVLSIGQIVDRPYRSDVATETYTKGTAATAQDLTSTTDKLTVNVSRDVLMYVDNIDKIQNKWSAATVWGQESAIRLANDIDAWFLYEVVNANNTVDDGSIGGTSGNGITLTTSNLISVYAEINEALDVDNIPPDERYIVISPQWKNILWKYIEGKQSALGDKTGQYGNLGEYAGLKHFLSNNLTGEAVWVPANNPSDADTVTIDGITFTFKTTIGTTAGNILIGATTAATITNLVAIINQGGASSDSGVSNVALSTANQRTVGKWVAVDGTTQLTVRVRGGSFLTVSGSDATDVWTAAKQVQLIHAGRKNAVDLVVQKNPSVEMDSTVSAGKWGMNILAIALFGILTFNQGKNELVEVNIRSDAF